LGGLVSEGKLENVSVAVNGDEVESKGRYGYGRYGRYGRYGGYGYGGYGYTTDNNKKK
jgi:hypothetical protein